MLTEAVDASFLINNVFTVSCAVITRGLYE